MKHKTVFATKWFNIEERYYNLPDMGGEPYYVINASDGVIIFATDEEDAIIMVRQFRPALNKVCLEFPSGGIDGNESAEDAARRELYEETGYHSQEMKLLRRGSLMVNRVNANVFAFYAPHAIKDPQFRPQEEIQVLTLNPRKLKDSIINDDIDQFGILSLLVLADWKYGTHYIA